MDTLNNAIRKAFSTDISIDEGERAVVARISTVAVDREGDVLVPMGCNTKDFERNPVVLWNHDYYEGLPLGKCVAIQRTADAIIAKTVFASRPEDYPEDEEWFPDTVYDLYRQKVLNAFSVGFAPIESRPATDRDQEKFGAGVRRVFSKWAVHEYSAVTIPMNQEAVAVAVGKGMMSKSLAARLFPGTDQPEASEPPPLVVPTPKTLVYVLGSASAETPDTLTGAITNAVAKARGRVYAL